MPMSYHQLLACIKSLNIQAYKYSPYKFNNASFFYESADIILMLMAPATCTCMYQIFKSTSIQIVTIKIQ